MSGGELFDPMTPPERTSMAWERTAFSGMAVGLLMTRLGATVHLALGLVGIAQVCVSAALLVWTGKRYRTLHGRLRAGEPATHPSAVAAVGIGTTVATALATGLAVVSAAVG
jgi:uncharacterized membrane protein YidH (DUF202 family)